MSVSVGMYACRFVIHSVQCICMNYIFNIHSSVDGHHYPFMCECVIYVCGCVMYVVYCLCECECDVYLMCVCSHVSVDMSVLAMYRTHLKVKGQPQMLVLISLV